MGGWVHGMGGGGWQGSDERTYAARCTRMGGPCGACTPNVSSCQDPTAAVVTARLCPSAVGRPWQAAPGLPPHRQHVQQFAACLPAAQRCTAPHSACCAPHTPRACTSMSDTLSMVAKPLTPSVSFSPSRSLPSLITVPGAACAAGGWAGGGRSAGTMVEAQPPLSRCRACTTSAASWPGAPCGPAAPIGRETTTDSTNDSARAGGRCSAHAVHAVGSLTMLPRPPPPRLRRQSAGRTQGAHGLRLAPAAADAAPPITRHRRERARGAPTLQSP